METFTLKVIGFSRVFYEGEASQVQLPLLHLGLLQAEKVRVQCPERVLETLAAAGPQAIHVP